MYHDGIVVPPGYEGSYPSTPQPATELRDI